MSDTCESIQRVAVCWLCPAEKHLVLLRDGRTLIGFLRSIDQFGRTLFDFFFFNLFFLINGTLLRKGVEDSRVGTEVDGLPHPPDFSS